MKTLIGMAAVLVLLAAPLAASATLIPANCNTCGAHNTSFAVTYALVPGGDAPNIYQVVITATYDPAGGASGTDFVYIDALSFKFNAFGQSDYENGTPKFKTASEGDWNVRFGGIDAGACSGSGNGFWCAEAKPYTHGATHGGAGDTDYWVFWIDVKDNLANLGATANGSFKAHFVDASGNKVGSLLSENTKFDRVQYREMPEPGSLLLIGTGVFGLAARRYRTRRT